MRRILKPSYARLHSQLHHGIKNRGKRKEVRVLREEGEEMKDFCSQCGKKFLARACGPTHALIAWERKKKKAPVLSKGGKVRRG